MTAREALFLLAGALLCRGVGMAWERIAADLRARRIRRARVEALAAIAALTPPATARTYPSLPDLSGQEASRVIELTQTKASAPAARGRR